MINTGNQVTCIKTGEALADGIAASLSSVAEYIREKFGEELKRKGSTYPAFIQCFRPEAVPRHTLDHEFVSILYSIASDSSENSKDTARKIGELLAYSRKATFPSAKGISGIKAVSKFLLFNLWCDGLILIPTTLTNFQTRVFRDFIDERETEVARFFRQYLDGVSHRPEGAPPLPKSGAWLLGHHSPRLIWATDWHKVGDVRIEEMIELNTARNRAVLKNGDNGVFSRSPFPCSLMLAELHLCYPERVPFDERHLEAFAYFCGSPFVQAEFTFAEIMENGLEAVIAQREEERREKERKSQREYNKRYPNRRYPRKPGAKMAQRRHKMAQRRHKTAQRRQTSSKKEELIATLNSLTRGPCEQAIEEYYCSISHLLSRDPDWLKHQSPYPGRERAIDLPALSSVWRNLYHSWLKWRKGVKGYETEDGPRGSLNYFFDYLFLYLPWWLEINPSSNIEFPSKPKDLTRFLFVSRMGDGEESLVAPKTFLELLETRVTKKNARYTIISHVIQFFDYIADACADDFELWGDAKNPFRKLLDLPRVSGRQKSSKTPFPAVTYPYLVRYVYAIEAFGLFLQEQAIFEDRYQRAREYRVETFDSQECGFVPVVFFRRKAYPILVVKNIYAFAARKMTVEFPVFPPETESSVDGIVHPLRRDDGTIKTEAKTIVRKIPILSAVRMFAGAIELGLRFQSIQWLDLLKWDRLNAAVDPKAYYFMLHVNTDKVKEGFDVPMVHRVRAAFLREQQYQLARSDRELSPVLYEGRQHSRFDPIVPLFRGRDEKPISDTKYQLGWVTFLVGFEEFFNGTNPDKAINLIKEEASSSGRKKISTTVTPHACRNTFIGEKRQDLDIEEVRAAVGHGSDIVTAYYHLPDMDRLICKLKRADEKLFAEELEEAGEGIESLSRDNDFYIHADDPNSALRQAFARDREAAIMKQGFTSFMFGHNEWGAGEDGVAVLRSTPSSMIVFLPTHICPVGQVCPEEIKPIIEEPMRCGLCPLCVTGLDHLQAVSAKRMALLIQVQDKRKVAERWECEERNAEEVDRLWSAAALDAKEEGAWRLREERMLHALRETQQGAPEDIHVDNPDLVKKHLLSVTKECGEREWMLRALARAYQYPTMQNPEIRAIADKERMKLLASAGAVDALMEDIEAGTEVEMLAGQLRMMMAAKGLSFEGVISALSEGMDTQLLAARNPTLLPYDDEVS